MTNLFGDFRRLVLAALDELVAQGAPPACLAFGRVAVQDPPPRARGQLRRDAGSVLAAELFNTALEELTDHLHPGRHARIKIVKDVAAAAVLVASLGALCVAAAFLYDKFG